MTITFATGLHGVTSFSIPLCASTHTLKDVQLQGWPHPNSLSTLEALPGLEQTHPRPSCRRAVLRSAFAVKHPAAWPALAWPGLAWPAPHPQHGGRKLISSSLADPLECTRLHMWSHWSGSFTWSGTCSPHAQNIISGTFVFLLRTKLSDSTPEQMSTSVSGLTLIDFN